MSVYPESIENLINKLMMLPGIGRKNAQKMALNIIELKKEESLELSFAINDATEKIKRCKKCHNLSEQDLCHICKNVKRDPLIIIVVDSVRDLIAIERTREFRGLYHVLHGVLSPLNGIGPKDLTIDSLLNRVKKENIKEVILATSPTLEGETTAIYISKLLKSDDLKITRIAHGVPIGGDIEFSDEVTLLKAIEGRKEI